jgi:uncharacterized membrane protein YqjE
MNTEQLLQQLLTMIIAFIATPIAFVLILIDILTNWLFEDQYKYRTSLYEGFGRILARMLRIN